MATDSGDQDSNSGDARHDADAQNQYVGVGLAIGVSIGTALSVALDSWAFVGVGIAIGIALGVAMGHRKPGPSSSNQSNRDSPEPKS